MAINRFGGTFSVIGGNGTVPQKTSKGLSLSEAIERINSKKRGTGRLGAAPTRDKIDVSVAEAVPGTATQQSTGLGSPWVEQYYDGAEGYYDLVSSDGLFIFETGVETDYRTDDDSGEIVKIKHRDPDAPPPTP